MTPTETEHIPDEILSAYVENDLSREDHERIARHLAECPQCAAIAQELATNRVVLAGLAPQKAPMSFPSRVQGRIRRRSRGRFFSSSTPGSHRMIYIVAAIVLVILAALYFFSLVSPEVQDAPHEIPSETPEQREQDARQPGWGEGSSHSPDSPALIPRENSPLLPP